MALYRCIAKKTSATSLTPSNSSPASIASGGVYQATANGYAISSYSSVTPSSTQTAVSSGDIVKIDGSGVIVNSVPTPTSLFPSNSNPVALRGKGLYRVEGDLGVTEGYAIENYFDSTPSDSSPAAVGPGYIVKFNGYGFIVESDPTTNPTLIGTKTVASTSAVTFNLDEGLSNYRYIYVTGSNYDGDKDSSDIQSANNLIKVSWFTAVANRTVTSYFTSGNTGSMYQRTQVMTYVNDTTVKIQNSSSVSRTIKIYGIK